MMAQSRQTLYPHMVRTGPITVEASGYSPVEGETIPRRNPVAKDKLIGSPSEEIKTIFDILKRSADKFGNAKAVGTRKILKTHQEVKKIKKTIDGETKEVDKKWTYFELSGYSYMSFVEFEKMVLSLGSGLRQLGLSKGDRVHLFATTRQVRHIGITIRASLTAYLKCSLACNVTCCCFSVDAYCDCIRHTWGGRA